MLDILIKNGNIVFPDRTINADLGIKSGKIASVSSGGDDYNAKKVIDATDLYVIPGGIDTHTHIYFPYEIRTNDTFETGTIASAYGGTTTIIDFATQKHGMSAIGSIEERLKEIEGMAVIDYALHSCLTQATEDILNEVKDIIDMGIASFKFYMTYRTDKLMVDDGELFAMLEKVAEYGGLAGVHAENAYIQEYLTHKLLEKGFTSCRYYPMSSPNIVESEAINRSIYLSNQAQSPLYIYHLSTKEGKSIIENAKKNGIKVYAETCPHYLTLTDDVYQREDARNFLVAPPIRKGEDREELWNGLKDGTISVVASDGIAVDSKMKSKGSNFADIPRGLAGVETRVPIIWSEGVGKGKLTPEEFSRVISTNPAKIMGIYPQKGILLPGSDADVVIIDPKKRVKLNAGNLHMQVDYSVYEDMECIGFPITTISRGRIIVENGKYNNSKGHGSFVRARIDRNILGK